MPLQIFTSITNFHVNSSYNEFVNHNTYLAITDLHFHGGPRSPTKDKYIDLEEKNDIHLHGGHDTPEPSQAEKGYIWSGCLMLLVVLWCQTVLCLCHSVTHVVGLSVTHVAGHSVTHVAGLGLTHVAGLCHSVTHVVGLGVTHVAGHSVTHVASQP